MGFQDRDYTREHSYTGAAGGWGLDFISPMVKRLIVANVVIFVVQIFAVRPAAEEDYRARWNQQPRWIKELGRRESKLSDELDKRRTDKTTGDKTAPPQTDEQVDSPPPGWIETQMLTEERVCIVHEWFDLKPSLVLRGQVWRLLTYSFCHDRMGVFHILFNMLFLYMFGMTLESMYGGREFLIFYLVAAVFAGITTIGLDLYLGSDIPAVGASGSVMAVVMLYAIHFPRALIRIWFISIEMRWVVVFYLIVDLYPVLLALAGDKVWGDVAHAGHLGGLLFGFLYWRTGARLENLWESIARGRRQVGRQARRLWGTYPKIARQLEQVKQDDVDQILQKLHESGVDSLTAAERRILEQESERLRRRKG